MAERLSSQEMVDNAQAATGARLVVFVRFDPAQQEARVETWAASRASLLQRGLAAVARFDPHFDPSHVAIKADVNRWARALYLEGQPVAAPFEEIAQGTVDARIVHVASAMLGLRHGFLCPVIIGTGVAGSLGFYTREALTDAQRRTAEAFSRQAALTLENARLLAAERHQRRIAHDLHQAALAVAAPVSDDPMGVAALLATIVGRAVAAVGGCDGWLTLVDDPAWDDLVPATGPADGSIRLERNGLLRRAAWRAHGVTRYVLATGELVNEPDTRAPARFGPYPDLVARGVASRVTLPLRASGRVLGALAVNYAHLGGSGEEDRQPLELFAAHAAAALERLRLAHAERQLARQAQHAAQLREEFVTAAVHDLKNPLTAIKGRAEHMRGQAAQLPRSERARLQQALEGLTAIEAAAERMAALLNQMLDAARLQAGQSLELVLHPTDLVALASRVVARYQEVTNHHYLVVEPAVAELVGMWDAFRLERVLENLLSNAIKYSPGGGEITVGVACEAAPAGAPAEAGARANTGRTGDEQRGDAPAAGPPDTQAVLTVRDHGLGIPEADRARIFERFGRGENVAGRIAGTGIGLAGVRQIVEQHGGTVAVDSLEGAGSLFTVRLPLDQAHAPRR